MNWLVNPLGRVMGFRGVDWLVELNNLYTKVGCLSTLFARYLIFTKVIHAGGSSNRTIDHIIKESPLIELYRDCHMAVENGFHLTQSATHHPI